MVKATRSADRSLKDGTCEGSQPISPRCYATHYEFNETNYPIMMKTHTAQYSTQTNPSLPAWWQLSPFCDGSNILASDGHVSPTERWGGLA